MISNRPCCFSVRYVRLIVIGSVSFAFLNHAQSIRVIEELYLGELLLCVRMCSGWKVFFFLSFCTINIR